MTTHPKPLVSRPRTTVWCAATIAVGLLGACESMSERQKGTAIGAGGGAVAGAAIGSATGHSAGKGALIGGAVGAVAGNLWSKRMEDKRKELETSTAGSGVEVERTQAAQNRRVEIFLAEQSA